MSTEPCGGREPAEEEQRSSGGEWRRSSARHRAAARPSWRSAVPGADALAACHVLRERTAERGRFRAPGARLGPPSASSAERVANDARARFPSDPLRSPAPLPPVLRPRSRCGVALHAALAFFASAALCAGEPADETAMRQLAERLARAYVFIGGGSGVLISADGLMLTNHHVAGASRRWQVRVGARLYEADTLGTDPRGDITLLQLRDARDLPFVAFADSDALSVGQRVMALGNPFGTAEATGEPTATLGIISALHRFQGTYSDAIQTDAPINPGNSGGPLLTLDGRLAGINGSIVTRHGNKANSGIGYAIPAQQIARFLPLLKAAKGWRVHHGTLRGLAFDNAEDDGVRNGAEVRAVAADSAAGRAGFLAGDRIVRVEEYPVLNAVRFLGVVGTYPGGSRIRIIVQRAGKEVALTTNLEHLIAGWLGFDVQVPKPLPRKPEELRALLVKPVVVGAVAAGGPAATRIKPGDAVIRLAGEPVAGLRDWARVTRSRLLLAGDPVSVTVRRGTAELVVDLVLGEQPDPEADSEEP